MPDVMSESQKKEAHENLKNFLLAGPLEIVVYFVIGLATLLILNFRAFANHIAGEATNSTFGVGQIITERINEILSHGRATSIIFWAVVGVFTYLFFWLMRNVFINLYNDFANDRFVHPYIYSRPRFWFGVLSLKAALILSTIVLGMYIFLLSNLMSVVSHQFYISVVSTQWLYQVPIMIGSILISAISVYILSKLAVLTLNLWRTIISGF